MTKKSKLIVSIIAVVCLVIIILGVCLGVFLCKSNNISFEVKDNLTDGNNRKARVILLGGQSNASGCSRDEYLKKNVSREKYSEYENGYDNVYINYITSQNESKGFVKCSTLQGEFGECFGPELGMAEKLNEMYPEDLFFIIKCAWGGTNLYEQWLSPSSPGKTGILYSKFVKYVETSMKYLISKNYEVEIDGMCWMQGESDSFSVEHATKYEQNLNNFINDVRKKFSKYQNDGIAFIDAYIDAKPAYWVYYEMVNTSKQKVAEMSSLNVVIDTVAEGLTCTKEPEGTPDMAHYDSLSEIKLGHLFIEEIAKFFK